MEQQKVNASYQIMETFRNVLLKVPSRKDRHLKFISEHQLVNADNEIVHVPQHFRRGDIIDGNFLTRRFYVDKNLLGSVIVADEVRLVSKLNFEKEETCFIIDIIKYDHQRIDPDFKLKCGSEKKEKNSFQIPKTDKFVSFIEA